MVDDGEFNNLIVNNVLTIGADIDLCSLAPNVLGINDEIRIKRPAATWFFACQLSTEDYPRFVIDSAGIMYFAAGDNTYDVNLYRSAANVLKTDDSLYVGG